MTEWQPIDTAPKDGTEILMFASWKGEIDESEKPSIHIAKYQYGKWWIKGGGIYATFLFAKNPIFWMPLPEPPK